jgi:RNA polymerase sigma-70 factor (ECF subfamily)
MEHQELIQRILGGESRAFGELVDRYRHMVFTVCMRVLRDREDAEEAAQDAFVKAFQNLQRFAGQSKFSTWLYTIAYRCAVSRGRRRKPATRALEDISAADQAMVGIRENPQEELRHHLGMAMERLSPEDASILSLYHLEEQSVEEIVTITGLGASNVKVRLMRARRKLETLLRAELGTEAQALLLKDG